MQRSATVGRFRQWCAGRWAIIVVTLIAGLAGLAAPAAAQPDAYVFVPKTSVDSVAIIDRLTGAHVGSLVPVGNGPFALAVTPDGRRVYVTNLFGNNVSVIDVGTQQVVGAPIPVGIFPSAIAITPDGLEAYVVAEGNNAVNVIDLTTDTVVTTIPVGVGPRGVGVTPDGQRVLVGNRGGGSVSVIDTSTKMVITTVPMPGGPSQMAITPDGLKAYVSRENVDQLSIIDLTSYTVTQSLPVGATPVGVAVTPDGAKVYVANSNGLSFSVIDVATDTVVATVPLGGNQSQDVAFAPDGGRAYISGYSSDVVTIVDVATNTVLTSIPEAGTPTQLRVSPNLINAAAAASSDADLTAQGFRSYVTFLGGTLTLTGNWTTNRTISVLTDNLPQTAGTLDTGAFNATVSGNIINGGTLIKRGAGTLTFNGTSTNLGGILVDEGTLAGTGTIGSLQVNATGTISPGVNGPGVLHVDNAIFSPGATFVAQINGPAAGTGYDQIDATGSVFLNSSTLVLQRGYAPAVGASFTIVKHAFGMFAGLPDGSAFLADNRIFRINYHGGSGNDVVLTVDLPPTISPIADQTINPNSIMAPVAFTVGDDITSPNVLLITATSSNHALIHDNPSENTLSIDLSQPNGVRTLYMTPERDASGQATITLTVSDGVQTTQRSFLLTVKPMPTYYLAEASTGGFFWTDISIANPGSTPALARMTFYKDDGTTATQDLSLLPTSQVTIPVSVVPGMAASAFSTSVVSVLGHPLVVERTMWWDVMTRYGASTEKASEQTSAEWFFSEGSQGYFHTYFLLLNPNATDTIAHVTYLMEDGPVVQRDYVVNAKTRLTVDAGAVPELINRSFGAHIVFDQPGLAERAMYFGMTPLFNGGAAASGVTAPANDWFLAEGATGSFFDTFVLIANPGNTDATLTVTYLPASGIPVVKTHPLAAHQRLTINIATEDDTLASAAVSTRVQSDQPVIVERSQYWPHGGWYESHSSAGETSAALKWGIADGRVGAPFQAQTYILVANPGAVAANITATFLRMGGTTLVKHFTVDPTSRFNIAITGDGGGNVPELIDESFGAVIESTVPVIVEHSLYTNSNGVIWAAGTNATGTRLP